MPIARSGVSGVAVVVSLVGVGLSGGVAWGQGSGLTQAEASPEQLLRDFVHYVRIDSREAAGLAAEQLVQAKLSPADWVKLVEENRTVRFEDWDDALVRASKKGAELAASAGKLDASYRKAKTALVRNPNEIAKSIAALTGLAKGRENATRRLVAAGEYAMPQLLPALLQRQDMNLRLEAAKVMKQLGRNAVVPLCTALPALDAGAQEQVAGVLGSIAYPTALPFLAELRASTASTNVADACARAMSSISASAGSASPADLFLVLANDYYARKTELLPFENEATHLLWSYDPSIGLVMSEITTPLFDEAMSMRMAERSLKLRADNNAEAIALWISANIRRELETGEGYENPEYPAGRRDASYYAIAAGADVCQRVLARALADKNTLLARRAIAALSETASAGALWRGSQGASPLLQALTYSDRRTRYESAMALAASNPTEAFSGSERVVPTLASAIRDVSDRYAILLAQDREVYDVLRGTITGAGFAVLPFSSTFEGLVQPMSEIPGVDLVVTAGNAEWTRALVQRVRVSPMTAATPMVSMVDQADIGTLQTQIGRDDLLALRSRAIGASELSASMEDVLARAGGTLSESDAIAYREGALAALRDLAVSRNRVLKVEDASSSLIRTLEEGKAGMSLGLAEVLAWIGEPRAQQAIVDRAIKSEGAARTDLLAKAADSARRLGNRLEPRQVERLIQLAKSGSQSDATAAAAVLGALNLPNRDLAELIISGR